MANQLIRIRSVFCAQHLRFREITARRRDSARIDRKQLDVLRSPLGSQPIERALGVVLLIGNHSANANHEIIQSFGSRPKIAGADRHVAKVGMKDRRQHSALGRAYGITEREVHLEKVSIAFEKAPVGVDIPSLDAISKSIDFRRDSGSAANFNRRPAGNRRKDAKD